MSTRTKSHPLHGAHTAGIFSDMSIDGPIIGTLVLIVDRAKNLPNRKTIGKQDPYCAARLGKEAQKTKTDIRGGQTPKWDQELRFTVHDSPDYYQLKLSVFNDDKKTDLIGEAWIDLRDIIISGGGQSDSWHGLTCRSKYAGEVRIEITFYDSRPKPEKPPAPKPSPADQVEGGSGNVNGSRPLPRAAPPKRRPLPSDPVTGQSPQPSVPDHAPTPPRPQPTPPASYIPNQSPLQAVEYSTPQSRRYAQPQPEQYSPTPPAGNYASPSAQADAQYSHRGSASVDRVDRYSAQGDDPAYDTDYRRQSQTQARYDPRSSFEDARSSYSMPPASDPRQFAPEGDRPPPPPAHRSRNNNAATQEAMMIRSGYDVSPTKGTPPTMRHDVLRNAAHRQSISHGSAYPGRPAYRPYDSAPAPLPNSPDYQAPEQHQPSPPRHHSYDANYDPHYRSMQPTVEDVPESPSPHAFRKSGSRPAPPPAAYDYDYDEPDYGNVPSTAPLNLSGRGSAASGHYQQQPPQPVQRRQPEPASYATSVSPVSARGGEREYSPQLSTSPGAYDSYSQHSSQHYSSSNQRDDFVDEPVNSAGQYGLPAAVPSSLVPGVDPGLALELSERIHEDRRRRHTQPLPPLETPPRGRRMIEAAASSPGYAPEGPSPQSYRTPQHRMSFDDRSSAVGYSGGGHSPSVASHNPRAVSPNPYHSASASASPNPHHTIKRKSISPAPPPSASESGGGAGGGRRLSAIPFGPDSYDELNPSVASARSSESLLNPSADVNESGKIVTHDGKEIDPSDHLPMDTWAPEPEPKKPSGPGTPSAATANANGRPSPAGAQPMPPSSTGRRQLRIAGRPTSASVAVSPSSPEASPTQTQTQTQAGGRNRLQKKSNRQSAMPVMMSGGNGNGSGAGGGGGGSSPLAPLPQGHGVGYDDGGGYSPGRQMVRASTFDFATAGENQAPLMHQQQQQQQGGYGRPRSGHGDGGGYRLGGGGPPPVPAKVPLGGPGGGYGGGGYGGYGVGGGGGGGGMMMSGGGGGGELSLAEEMSRIDIGTGRARRHRERERERY